MDKKELRSKARQILAALTQENLMSSSRLISKNLKTLSQDLYSKKLIQNGLIVIGAYAPIQQEVIWFSEFDKKTFKYALPHISNETEMEYDCIYGPAYKGIFLGSMVAVLLSQNGNNYPLSFDRKEVKDHGEGGNIIGNNPIGNVMIIDDVLSAGTAARQSIELINRTGAISKIFIVGLDRQEKGSADISASKELQNDFGITVKSIVNLDTLISFTENNSDYAAHLGELKAYRDNWGA